MSRSICRWTVCFVGDQHGNHGLDPDIAFVGSKSYLKLLEWIAKLDLMTNQVNIVNKKDISYYTPGKVYIALGDKASKHLGNLFIEHFKMPHPSGRNRKLNNKSFEKKMLKECYKWIRK